MTDTEATEQPGTARVLGIQLGVFFLLMGFLLLGLPAIISTVQWLLPEPVDPRGELAIYDNMEWSSTHFREFNGLETQYRDFIGWRRAPFVGETITIDERGVRQTTLGTGQDSQQGVRRTTLGAGEGSQQSVLLLGGSVAWGTGSRDEETMASLIAEQTGADVTNWGESAWVAQQSTNLLLNLTTLGERPDLVLSLDGANEVLHKCRAENSAVSGGREQRFRAAIEGAKPLSVLYAIKPLLFMASEIKRMFGPDRDPDAMYDCASNPEKARQVAANLITNWETASRIVSEHGGRYLPMLQPVAFFGASETSYLPDANRDTPLGKQFEAVYPEIKRQLARSQLEWLDLEDVFDGQQPVYVDFCHVIPAGNQMMVDRILSHLAPADTAESAGLSLQ